MARDPLAEVHAEAVRTRVARDTGAQPSGGETPPTD
jgi:hypothetical protein